MSTLAQKKLIQKWLGLYFLLYYTIMKQGQTSIASGILKNCLLMYITYVYSKNFNISLNSKILKSQKHKSLNGQILIFCIFW